MCLGAVGEGPDLSDLRLACKGFQPTDFHQDPISDQAKLTHEGAKIVQPRLVSTVEWRNREQ
jgi:hypothetical protein